MAAARTLLLLELQLLGRTKSKRVATLSADRSVLIWWVVSFWRLFRVWQRA
jgi:uncharacterized membrane protein